MAIVIFPSPIGPLPSCSGPGAPQQVATTDDGRLWLQLDDQILMLDQGKQVWSYPVDKQKSVQAKLAPATALTWLIVPESANRYLVHLLGPDGKLQNRWVMPAADSVQVVGVSRTGDLVSFSVHDAFEDALYVGGST